MPSLDNPFDFPGINIKQGSAAGGQLAGTYPNPTINAALLSFPAWTSYTPTISASVGTITTSSATGKYLQLGKLIFVSLIITITTNGSGASTLQATVPATSASHDQVGFGRVSTGSGKMLQALLPSSTSRLAITNYDNTYPGADGTVHIISIFYETS